MLAVLSTLSITRPVGWTVSTYLIARDRPRIDAALEILKLVSVVVLVLTLGRLGPVWACVGVGLAFAIHAVGSMWVVRQTDGVAISALLVRCARPLAACGPMVLAVLAARRVVNAFGGAPAAVALALEVSAGAVAYVASCPWLARPETQDALGLARRGFRRGEERPAQEVPEPAADVRSPR
jgi:PST family polysaccharide transporter